MNRARELNKIFDLIGNMETVVGTIPAEDLEPWIITLADGYEYQTATTLAIAIEMEILGYHIRHAGEVMISRLHEFVGQYVNHDGDKWTRLLRVEASQHQGWDIVLEGDIRLQSCTVRGSYMVRANPQSMKSI